MSSFGKRFLGVSFIIFAVLGILISLTGIVWRVKTTLLDKIIQATDILDSTLSTTYDGMDVLYDTLDKGMETLDSTEKVLFAMANTIGDINNFSSNFLKLLPINITGLQQQDSTSDSQGTNQLDTIETEMENIASNFKGINFAMISAQGVVKDYQEILNLSKDQIEFFQLNFPKWISTTTWILTILLAWFAITQIGFILQGVNFYRSAGESVESSDNNLN